MKTTRISNLFIYFTAVLVFGFQACSTFTYKTYDDQKEVDDPEPNYDITLNPEFQGFTSFMFIGNRVENFGTYFNTFYNAKENYEEAYDDYVARVLSTYIERLDSIYATPTITQEAKDKFNRSIEKASKVIQYHKSSAFMDQAVLLIGKCYFYLGDYLKAERKFGEFVSKLSKSELLDEALLFLSRTQFRMGSNQKALETLNDLIKNSKDKQIVAGAYQSLGEFYISRKDYKESINNYKKSIEFSNDNEFKAQMQFLIASVTAREDHKKGAAEFKKVLDYNTSFELEYLARYNHVKNLILSSSFGGVLDLLDELRVDYKEYPEYLSDIEYLVPKYYEQKKDYKRAVRFYKEVIINYPKTIASSDASYSLAGYYENIEGDYLTAYKYYKYSNDESTNGHNAKVTNRKIPVFKRYFELSSIISETEINTNYDTLFLRELQPELLKEGQENKGESKPKGKGEDGGEPGVFGLIYVNPSDSLLNTNSSVDSLKLKQEAIIKAKFELAELFIYNLSKPDSAEKYLDEAYRESDNPDFKSKVLFALAVLYKNNARPEKYEQTLRNIVEEYPLSAVSNECRKILNLPVVNENSEGPEDSIFTQAENKFVNLEYADALSGFIEISSNYPASKYFMKSTYAAGWIYENVLNKPDSAVYYYTKVAENTAPPEFYDLVIEKLTVYNNISTENYDSLGTQTDTNVTNPPGENKLPIEDGQIDNTNSDGENTDPVKKPDLKKEESGEIKGEDDISK